MNFGNDIYSYDVERVADLKSMTEYGKRTIKRLQDELKETQQIIEKQMGIIDNVNTLFATTKASAYCTNEQSAIYQTLTKEKSEPKQETTSIEIPETIGNLYKYPQTEEIIESLNQSADFHEFFYDYPLAFITLFDSSPIQFDTDAIILEAEKWPTEKRMDFFTAFFDHLNSAAYFLSSLLTLVDCKSIPILSEYLETELSTVLNCAKVAFFMFDAEEDELIMDKHQIQMRIQLKSGIVYDSIINNNQSLVSRGFEKASKEDLTLLKNNQVLLSTPIYCNSVPTAVFLLYDKIGGFRQFDYLVAKTISKFISEAIPVIMMREDREKVSEMLDESLDSFLRLVSAEDLKSFLDVFPSTFCEAFQCEHSKIFRISDDGLYFSEISEDGEKAEKFSIRNRIIGQSITQKEAIRVTRPEYTQSFCGETDRPNPAVMTESIMVCPILDEPKSNGIKGIPRFVVALFNKKDIDGFTEFDMEKMKLVCENLNNVMMSLFATSNLTTSAENSQQKVTLYNALFDLLTSLSAKETVKESLESIEQAVKSSITASKDSAKVDLFYVEQPNQNITSISGDFDSRLFSSGKKPNEDPIVRVTETSEIKQMKNDKKSTTVFCGLKGTENNPTGLIRLNMESANFGTQLKKFSTMSPFNSTANLNIGNEEKDESNEKNSGSQLEDLNDKALLDNLEFWKKMAGPIIDSIIKKSSIKNLIQICDKMIEKLPKDPFLAVSVFNDMQYMMNSNVDDGNSDGLRVTFISKTSEYYQRTRELIVSFSLLLASSQKDMEESSAEEADEDISKAIESPSQKVEQNDWKFNVFSHERNFLNEMVLSLFEELRILEYLSVGREGLLSIIVQLRSMHKPDGFKTWDLAIDHFQFAAFLVKNIGKAPIVPVSQTCALLFYLLSMYCQPYLRDPEMSHLNGGEYSAADLVTKYYIENGRGAFPLSFFIAAVSGMKPNSQISQQIIDEIAPLMRKLDAIQSFEFVNSNDLFVLIACIARFSYLARPEDVAKIWIERRSKEEFFVDEVDDQSNNSYQKEIIGSQLDFDLKSILLPCFGEFVKQDLKIDHIRKLFTTTISNISGVSF